MRNNKKISIISSLSRNQFKIKTTKSVIPENSKNLSGIYKILKEKLFNRIQGRFLFLKEGQNNSIKTKNYQLKTNYGFTLVELIVTISILSILGTIGFISIQNYFSTARDSARISDIATLYKALIITKEKTGEYPLPSNSKEITYSGGLAWYQGLMGESVIRYVGNVSNKPVDPKYKVEYTYSVTSNKQEFQIAGITEEKIELGLNPFFDKSFAVEGNFSDYVAYIKGDFDELFVAAKNNGQCISISTPSIILADINSTELKNYGSGYLVYRDRQNIPESYVGSFGDNISYTGSFLYKNFNDSSIIIYTGCTLPNTLTGAIQIAQNIKKSYENTSIEQESNYKTFVETIDARTLTSIGVGVVNNNFVKKGITGTKIVYDQATMLAPSFTCADQPIILHSTSYTQGNPTEFNQSWVYSDTPGNCTFACESGRVRDNNTKSCIEDLCQGNLSDLNGVIKSGTTQSVSQSWKYDNEDNDNVCRYVCADGHTYNSTSKKCEPNNCSSNNILIGDHDYLLPSMNHGENILQTSNPITITGGTLSYEANFECSLGDLSYVVGSEVHKSTTCDTNYTANGEDCNADTKSATCTGKPTNSIWNTVSSITQTWNGTTWLPLTTISYSTTPSTTLCKYQCDINYHTEDSGTSCISNTKSCTITNGTGQQSWNTGINSRGTCMVVSCNSGYVESSNTCIADVCNGTIPTNATSNATSQTVTKSWTYNTTPGQCTFKCDTNYTWNGSSCVANTQTYSCSATKPANSSWNTVSSYLQTWNGSTWTPADTTTVYNTTASTTSCRYSCSTNYHTEDSGTSCISNTRSCTITNGVGSQTWNTGTSTRGACTVVSCNSGYSISGNTCVANNCLASTQTVNTRSYSVPAFNNGTNTTQSVTQTITNGSITYSQTFACNLGSVSTSGGETSSPTCNTNYTWNGSSCVADTQIASCTGLPTNSSWNTVSSITQTWNGTTWLPTTTGTYNTTASTTSCNFKCNANYTWNGSNACTDQTAPTITSITSSSPACNTIRFTINGATDAIGLSSTPYSFDGGSTWQLGNIKDYMGTSYTISANMIKVRDIAGNIYTYVSSIAGTSSSCAVSGVCTSLPSNALYYNSTTSYSLTSAPAGTTLIATTAGYNASPTSNTCQFKCNTTGGYVWNGTSCILGASCTVSPFGTISHLGTVTAYQTASVLSPSTCTSETRTCNNGTLGGSYTNASCKVCPTGTTYNSGNGKCEANPTCTSGTYDSTNNNCLVSGSYTASLSGSIYTNSKLTYMSTWYYGYTSYTNTYLIGDCFTAGGGSCPASNPIVIGYVSNINGTGLIGIYKNLPSPTSATYTQSALYASCVSTSYNTPCTSGIIFYAKSSPGFNANTPIYSNGTNGGSVIGYASSIVGGIIYGTYTCPSGGTLSGTNCLTTSTIAATCVSGTVLNGTTDKCEF